MCFFLNNQNFCVRKIRFKELKVVMEIFAKVCLDHKNCFYSCFIMPWFICII